MSSWTDTETVYLGGNRWRLVRDTRYDVGRLGSGVPVVVPAGYVCDLASVPRVWRWLVRRTDLDQASVLHDYLLDEGWTRYVASALFREAAIASGVSPAQAWMAYCGTRLWDGLRWVQSL